MHSYEEMYEVLTRILNTTWRSIIYYVIKLININYKPVGKFNLQSFMIYIPFGFITLQNIFNKNCLFRKVARLILMKFKPFDLIQHSLHLLMYNRVYRTLIFIMMMYIVHVNMYSPLLNKSYHS